MWWILSSAGVQSQRGREVGLTERRLQVSQHHVAEVREGLRFSATPARFLSSAPIYARCVAFHPERLCTIHHAGIASHLHKRLCTTHYARADGRSAPSIATLRGTTASSMTVFEVNLHLDVSQQALFSETTNRAMFVFVI
jgi:hypothetical protein